MIRIELAASRVQWTDDDGAHHVGRVLQDVHGNEVRDYPNNLLKLVVEDHGRGYEFVDERKLTTYPDAPIPEPTNTGAAR